MAQFGAELQLLHQPVAPVGQRTVADQHDPVPGVQRKRRAPSHQTVQHTHRQACTVQHPRHAAAHQKARCGARFEQPGPPGVQVHRQQVQRRPGLLLGSLQAERHVHQPGSALRCEPGAQQLCRQLGRHLTVHGGGAARTHAVAQKHLRPPARVAELVQRVAADALPAGCVRRRAKFNGKQRFFTKAQHRDRAAVGDFGRIHVAAADAAHLVGQARDLVGGEARAADRHIRGQPSGQISGHTAFQRVQPQLGKQLRHAGLAPRVGQTGLAQLARQLGQRPGQCAVLLGQGGAQRHSPGTGLAAAAPQPVAVVGRCTEVRRVDAPRQLPRQVLDLHAALALDRRLQMVQPVHGRGVAAHPAPAAAGAALAGRAGDLLHHKVKGLALGRQLPLADRVDRVGNVAQRVRHGGELACRPAQALRLHGRRGRRENFVQHAPRHSQRGHNAHPGTDRQRQHTDSVGRGQCPRGAARRKHPGAAAPLPRAEAGRRQTAQRHSQRGVGQCRPRRRDGCRQRNAQHGGLLQRAADGRAQPGPRGQRQARSQGPDGTALQACRSHSQPQADAARLPRRKMRERPAKNRGQQRRTPHRDGLPRVEKSPRQHDLQHLRRRQRQAARQRPGPGAAINEPPHCRGRHGSHGQLDAQQHRLERQPRRQRAQRRGQAVGRRAADDQRQPKRRSPAVDLPGPQRRAAQHCRALPQQRRTARPGQQPFHCVVHTFPVQYSHRASPP